MSSTNYGEAKKLPQYVAALSVCMGSVAAGTVLGWTGNMGDKLPNDVVPDTDIKGWIGSAMNLGAMVMCFPIGISCDLIGRKLTMLLTIIPFTLGWLLIIFCNGPGMIYAGRVFTGMGGGAFCVAAPLYTSEIAQTEIRGALGSYFQLLLTVGILFSYILGAYVDPIPYTIVCAVIPFVFGVIFFLQPETPIYLVKKGKFTEALKALKRLRGNAYNCEPELEDIKREIAAEQNSKVSFFKAIQSKASKKAIFICFGLMFFQQLSGINAVIFYTNDIFESAGSSLPSEQAVIYIGITQVVATFISSLIIDKFGRKILLITSDALMMLAGLLLGIYFTLKDRQVIDADTAKDIGFLPIVSMIVFIAAFSLGFGPIPWVASSEIMPPEIRATASSAAATFNWFLAFLVTKFYLNVQESIGGDVTFYIFTGVSLVGIIFVFFIVPETKGKTSAEVQDILNGVKTSRSNGTGIDNPSFSN